ncbi:MAG: hypothetical protein KF723_22940 [Rhizobiaceae bacterium]|nr:hypothetical protein [Rhizobiaceae bacterium]
MATITKAMLVNWALIDLGQPANFSVDAETGDDSTLGGIVDLIWQRVVDECFGFHDWYFCRATAPLVRRLAAPITGYAYAFDLPGDKLGDTLKIFTDPKCTRPLRDFYLEGRQLHCNEAAAYARYKVMVDPDLWDPGFRSAFVTALASYLAVPVLHDLDMKSEKWAEAFGTPSQGMSGGKFGRLISQSRAAEPLGAPFAGNDPLVDARFM